MGQVGVLIGKAGDTIRYLQLNSGARIQITRDVDADPYAGTRPVELIGTLESVIKAEKLIKDVIAEVFLLRLFPLLRYWIYFFRLLSLHVCIPIAFSANIDAAGRCWGIPFSRG